MKSFQIWQPTRILFGASQAQTFINHLSQLGNRIFIVLGGSSVKNLGYFDQVIALLNKCDLSLQVFEGIEPNPQRKTINKAANEARDFNADLILAFGGGSIMDASKAIAALTFMKEDDIWPFTAGQSKYRGIKGAIPVATIATTAATASEITQYGVISDSESQGKAPISHESLKPKLSWLNPEFTTSLPKTTTQDGAADILSHVFENYLLGGESSILADLYTEGIIKTVLDTLPLVTKNPGNVDLRARLLWASNLALNGYQLAGRELSPFTLHNLEHAMSGYNQKLAHGRGLATLYSAYFTWLITHNRCINRFSRLASEIYSINKGSDKENALEFVHKFTDWLRDNELLQSMSEIGIPESAYESIVDYAIKTYGYRGVLEASGELTRSDILEIFTMTQEQRQNSKP